MSHEISSRARRALRLDARRAALLGCVAACLLAPWSIVRASRSISEHRAADPAGDVEIENVSGSVDVRGWDRNEVEVGGTAGDGVDQVEVTGNGGHTTVHVITHGGHFWGSTGEAKLVVHVPSRSAVSASLVSADFKIEGVLGSLELRTTSGEVKGEVGGDVHASTVSGDIKLTARAAKSVELKTISGDIDFKGGGGEVEATTVSGTVRVELAEISRARLRSVSGDWSISAELKAGGQIEGESVSGDMDVALASPPGAEVDVQTLSGDISNCFGPKPVQVKFGPGTRLQFTAGDGRGRIRLTTKSGDVKLCAGRVSGEIGGAPTSPVEPAPAPSRVAAPAGPRLAVVPEPPKRRFAMMLPYVI